MTSMLAAGSAASSSLPPSSPPALQYRCTSAPPLWPHLNSVCGRRRVRGYDSGSTNGRSPSLSLHSIEEDYENKLLDDDASPCSAGSEDDHHSINSNTERENEQQSTREQELDSTAQLVAMEAVDSHDVLSASSSAMSQEFVVSVDSDAALRTGTCSKQFHQPRITEARVRDSVHFISCATVAKLLSTHTRSQGGILDEIDSDAFHEMRENPASPSPSPSFACPPARSETPLPLSAILGVNDEVPRYDSIHIIDCRYFYEYSGGHIRQASHLESDAELEKRFFACPPSAEQGGRICLIFHCEFSQKRGPRAARYFRQRDREFHVNAYPQLYYPEVYVMESGYKSFCQHYPTLCVPEGGYVAMTDKRYRNQMRSFDQHNPKRNKSSGRSPSHGVITTLGFHNHSHIYAVQRAQTNTQSNPFQPSSAHNTNNPNALSVLNMTSHGNEAECNRAASASGGVSAFATSDSASVNLRKFRSYSVGDLECYSSNTNSADADEDHLNYDSPSPYPITTPSTNSHSNAIPLSKSASIIISPPSAASTPNAKGKQSMQLNNSTPLPFRVATVPRTPPSPLPLTLPLSPFSTGVAGSTMSKSSSSSLQLPLAVSGPALSFSFSFSSNKCSASTPVTPSPATSFRSPLFRLHQSDSMTDVLTVPFQQQEHMPCLLSSATPSLASLSSSASNSFSSASLSCTSGGPFSLSTAANEFVTLSAISHHPSFSSTTSAAATSLAHSWTLPPPQSYTARSHSTSITSHSQFYSMRSPSSASASRSPSPPSTSRLVSSASPSLERSFSEASISLSYEDACSNTNQSTYDPDDSMPNLQSQAFSLSISTPRR